MIVGAIDPSRDIIINSKLIDILKRQNLFVTSGDATNSFDGVSKKTALQKKSADNIIRWIKKLKLNLTMIIEQIYTGCLSQGAYYIQSANEAAIIDPLRKQNPTSKKLKKPM